jgi:hypothetical protein
MKPKQKYNVLVVTWSPGGGSTQVVQKNLSFIKAHSFARKRNDSISDSGLGAISGAIVSYIVRPA